ncbi:MAG: sensor domain-containing diguanylate cyclase [Vulcanimicrobiaceae bacterium]
MLKPGIPVNEPARLHSLRALNILDTLPEERFDRVTRLAKRLFGVPIALISLIDENRQWFKSNQGLGVSETPREISFCAHAIFVDDVFIVPDTLADERFYDNPLVINEPHVRFYAGRPLQLSDGNKIGTLCLLDSVPREFDSEDRKLLHDLAIMAEREIEAVQMATMDDLTQLSNRRGMLILGEHGLKLCNRLKKSVSLFFFDLDDFKTINDRFGHAEGDHALQAFARLLTQTFRDADVIARIGGDEFVVMMTDCTAEQGNAVAQRLSRALDEYNNKGGRGYVITFSVGVIVHDSLQPVAMSTLIAEADAEMYERKRRSAVAQQP